MSLNPHGAGPGTLNGSRHHSTKREGLQLGLCVAAVTWLWIAALDALSGAPFRTMQALGGIATFSTIHVLLCIAYGITIVAAVHAAMRTPTVVFAMVFCTILFQAAFVMLTSFLGQLGPGSSAWTRFFAGNVIAAGLTGVFLWRTHPLRALYHLAEAEV